MVQLIFLDNILAASIEELTFLAHDSLIYLPQCLVFVINIKNLRVSSSRNKIERT